MPFNAMACRCHSAVQSLFYAYLQYFAFPFNSLVVDGAVAECTARRLATVIAADLAEQLVEMALRVFACYFSNDLIRLRVASVVSFVPESSIDVLHEFLFDRINDHSRTLALKALSSSQKLYSIASKGGSFRLAWNAQAYRDHSRGIVSLF